MNRIAVMLLAYFSVSAILFAAGTMSQVKFYGEKLVPAVASLLLLVPIYLWYSSHKERAKLSFQLPEKAGRSVWIWVLGLFLLAMAVRIPMVLLTGMAWEKTAVIYLVTLSIVFVFNCNPALFSFKTENLGRALAVGLVYYTIFEFSSAFSYALLVYFFTGEIVAVGYNPLPFLFAMPFMTLCVGISEEGLFRGFMQTLLGKFYSQKKANLIQALLFGFWHFVWNLNPLDLAGMSLYIAGTFLVGALFGYFYSLTKNIMPLIIVHGLVDSFPSGYIFNQNALNQLQNQHFAAQITAQMLPSILPIIIMFLLTKHLAGKLTPQA